jgi:FlaA1/EpsC-like NDP-sugar epimerase
VRQLFICHRRALIIGLHLLLVPLGYYLAFLLRFDFDPRLSGHYLAVFLKTLPLVLVVRAVTFGLFRLYRGWWRYVGVSDLVALFKGVTLSSIVLLPLLYILGLLHGYPRSVFVLDWAVALMLFGGLRFAVRVVREEPRALSSSGLRGRRPAVIIGAGNAGERLVRALSRDRESRIAPVAFVDDDPAKRSMSLHGVPMLGTTYDLGRILKGSGADLAIIAIPSASSQHMQRIVDLCKQAGVQCQVVPSLPELLDGSAQVNQIRDVQIEDLLGRGMVNLDLTQARRQISGKVVMVTGGAGSIGSELARQLAMLSPSRLILVDQAESPLYFIDLEIRQAHPEIEVRPVILDITDKARISELFSQHRPQFVFHAAAYKHVPLMEDNVGEAVRNNVLGTLNVAENAARVGAEKFVLISTDKAVRPSSVMGATKRISERIVLGLPALRRSRTDFRAVRFGNVLGSAGSVIPLFKKQLAAGGPLTVTHPDVTRYFMTILEAAQLVLISATLPEAAGRIAMLEMGEAVKIKDLAENLIRLSGFTPGHEIKVHFTGMRPGEKLVEELMSAVEETVPTAVQKICVVQTDEADVREVKAGMGQLLASVAIGQTEGILAAMGDLVPECVSPLRERVHRGTSILARRGESKTAVMSSSGSNGRGRVSPMVAEVSAGPAARR